MAVSEIDYNAPLKHHMKWHFLEFRHKRFSDTVYTDNLMSKIDIQSIRGFRYAQVFLGKHAKLIKFPPSKSDLMHLML